MLRFQYVHVLTSMQGVCRVYLEGGERAWAKNDDG